MENILNLLKEELQDLIINIEEEEDEVKVFFQQCEMILKDKKKIDIYRRFIYSDYSEEKEMKSIEREQQIFAELLGSTFNNMPLVYDDSCIGCPAIDEIVGYYNIDFNIDFIRKFVSISEE